MCTPRYDITLDQFMRVAHLLPRQRGNVAVDNYTFVNALLWMCRTGAPVEGPAGVLWQVDRLPAVQPLARERRDEAPVHGIAGGADHRGGDPGARHGFHEREGPPARGRGAEKGGSRSVGVSRGGRNTKIHVVSDSESTIVEIHPGPGNEHDAAHGRRSMAALGAFMGAHLLMDRAYEGDSTRLLAESFGLTPVVPPKEKPCGPMGSRQGGVQGAEHGRTRLQPHEALPQGRHPLRQARRDPPRQPPAHPHRRLPEEHSQKPN